MLKGLDNSRFLSLNIAIKETCLAIYKKESFSKAG